jgi:hypothetical protein
MIGCLEKLAPFLDVPAHLLVWAREDAFEVVAVRRGEWMDAFPLPLEIQSAAAEAGLILDTRTAARLEFDKIPDDFWDEIEEVEYGKKLTVSVLGRPGRKYLEVYRGVSSGEITNDLRLYDGELLKVTRWLREQGLFDHRQGDQLMEVLAHMRK